MRVLLVLPLLLAGCAGTIQEQPDAPTLSMPETLILGPEVAIATNPNSQSEAAISVSADGQTILSCFHGFFSSLSPGIVSQDGGATWHDAGLPQDGLVGGDCETAITHDGSWAFLASTVAGATVMVTSDEGSTWTTNHVTAIPTNGLADRPWLEAVGNELWLAYMPVNVQPGTVGFTKSTDKGATWSTPSHIGLPGPTTYSLRHGHFQVGPDSVQMPIVRYSTVAMLGSVVQVASTTDGGATWGLEEIYAGTQVIWDWPGMAITETGRRLVTVSGEGPQDTDLFGLIETDGTWSDPMLLVAGDNTDEHWSFADGGHGDNASFVVTGCCATPHTTVGHIDLATGNLTTWTMERGESVEFASIAHDAAGIPYVVWTGADDQYFVKGAWGTEAPDPRASQRRLAA